MMEILIELLAYVIGNVVLSGIGWFCLWVWYRDREKMEEIKNKKYAGEYKAAGIVMILNLIAGIGALSLSVMLIAILVTWIYRVIAAGGGH